MLRRAINTVTLAPGESSQWVQLLPAGEFTGRDGAGPYRNDDPQAVIDATLAAASGADLPIDYDHQTLWSPKNGRPAPAAGWIKQYQARADGVWGFVEWTQAAAAKLADREYRYLSPVFWHDASGKVIRIEHAALTNVPNLELAAVASRLATHDGGEMDPKQIAALVAALGLPADTSAEKLVAHAKALADKAKADGGMLAAMAKRLGLPETAPADGIAAAVDESMAAVADIAKAFGLSGVPKAASLAAHAKELIEANQGQAQTAGPDPTKFVPVEQFRAVNDRLGAIETKLAGDAASRAVEAAMAAGKVIPATREWALAYASKDLAGFESLMTVAPVILKPGREGPAGQTPPANGELDETELAVCSRMGLSPEEFKKHRQQEGA